MTNVTVQARRGPSYPNKLFSLGEHYVPNSIRDMYPYCAYYGERNSLVSPVINKLADYSITPFIYKSDDDEDKKRAKNLYEQKWRMRQVVVEFGKHFYTFGSGFAPVLYCLRRYLQCRKCDRRYQVRSLRYRFHLARLEFEAECPQCRWRGPFRVRDVYPRRDEFIRPMVLDTRDIHPRHNKATRRTIYLYNIPSDLRRQIAAGDPYVMDDIPWVFVQCVQQNRKLELDPSVFYHALNPGLSVAREGLGTPLMLPVFPELYYRSTLQRGQEAISLQHIVPLVILFPQQSGADIPAATHNLADWRKEIEKQFKIWQRDPNYVPVIPQPIGVESVFGDARALLLGPDLEANKADVVNGMGFPIDVLTGGMTWSGGSVSMRMIEQTLISHRANIDAFLDFAGDRAWSYLDMKPVPTRMQAFRMADDIQRMQLLMTARQLGDITRERIIEEFGEDPTTEQRRRMNEVETDGAYQRAQQKEMAIAAGEASVIQARYQMRAQSAAQQEQVEQANRETTLRLPDPQALVTLLADMIMASEGEEQAYALEQLGFMPTLRSLVYAELQGRLSQGEEQQPDVLSGSLDPEEQETGGGTDMYAAEPAEADFDMGIDDAMPDQLPPRRGGF
jgi:hypothetical protein